MRERENVMTELVMTVIFFYSIYKISGDYPVISVALIVCYLSALSSFVYMTLNP